MNPKEALLRLTRKSKRVILLARVRNGVASYRTCRYRKERCGFLDTVRVPCLVRQKNELFYFLYISLAKIGNTIFTHFV